MADYFAVQALDSYPAIDQAQAGEVGVAYGEFSITATVPLLAATDLIHMVWLPARHRVVDCIIQMDQIDNVADLDTNTGLTDDPDGATEDPNALIDGDITSGRAITVARMDEPAGLLIAPTNNRRRFGFQIDVDAATQLAGTLRMWLMYRASDSRDA